MNKEIESISCTRLVPDVCQVYMRDLMVTPSDSISARTFSLPGNRLGEIK